MTGADATGPTMAVVGEVDGGLARALGRRGADVTRASVNGLHVLDVEHVVLLGAAAIDGGAAASERAPRHARLYVVLPGSAAAARLEAVRLGATVIDAAEGDDGLADAILAHVAAPGDRLGWVELGPLLDAVRERLVDKVSGPSSRRVELELGSGERVLGAVQRFVDELAREAKDVRDAGTLGPRVAVDELTWDDDPQTVRRAPEMPLPGDPARLGGARRRITLPQGSGPPPPMPGVEPLEALPPAPSPPSVDRLPSGITGLPSVPRDPELDETRPHDALQVEREILDSFTLEADPLDQPPTSADDGPTGEHRALPPAPPPPSAMLPAATLPLATPPAVTRTAGPAQPEAPQASFPEAAIGAPPTAPAAPPLERAPVAAAAAPARSGPPWALLAAAALILVTATGVAGWIALRSVDEDPLAIAAAPEPPAAPAETTPAVAAPGIAGGSTPSEAAPTGTPTGTGTAPTEATPTATPTETAPTEASPAETSPAEAAPSEASPAEPSPAEPAPAEASPAEPSPTAPAPSEAGPADPTPSEATPAPSEPAGAEADGLDPEAARALSDARVDDGRAAEAANRWDEARRAYEAALAVYENNPHAVAGLARERLAANDAPGATRYAERAVRLRRRRAEYHVLLGDARRAGGDEAGARRAYERALQLDEDNRDAQRRLGR